MSERVRSDLAAVLDWYLAMGVDAPIADAAIDWLDAGRAPPGHAFALAEVFRGAGADDAVDVGPAARGAAAAPQSGVRPAGTATAPALQRPHANASSARPAVSPPSSPVRTLATPPPDQSVTAARAAARNAASILELEAALRSFDGCALKASAKSLCFYRGAASAPLMIIGEAPGRDEDLAGKPFVGRAGQLLDRMLAAIGIDDSSVHITNVVYWRPPGNRTPTALEAEICRPFLERQVELVAPRVLLLLGGTAAKNVLRTEEGILRLRGRWTQTVLPGLTVATLASLHPAYLLRTPAAKGQAWRDFLSLKRALEGHPPGAGRPA